MFFTPSSQKPMTYSLSEVSIDATKDGIRKTSCPRSSCTRRKYAVQPFPLTSTSNAVPSPELRSSQMNDGSGSPRSSSQTNKPGTASAIGDSGLFSYLKNVQSACGRLCHGHHTEITADATATPVAHHVATSPQSMIHTSFPAPATV